MGWERAAGMAWVEKRKGGKVQAPSCASGQCGRRLCWKALERPWPVRLGRAVQELLETLGGLLNRLFTAAELQSFVCFYYAVV